MKIVQAAMAGTLESSDLMVKVSPDESGLDVVIQSEVYKQFGDRIAEVVNEVAAQHRTRGRSLLMIKVRWTA
jgi:citrate lyase subunit gamma (acyl carrier protein)